MNGPRRNVLVLSGCQATLQAVAALVVAIGGLAGAALAEDRSLATVPLTCFVLGAAIATVPASALMGAIGRRAGFQAGAALGALGAALGAYAMYRSSFPLLCAGMTFIGMHIAFGNYYRFAAADAVDAGFRPRAISLTLAGGLIGGALGPEIAGHTVGFVAGHPFAAPFLALVGVCLTTALLLTWLDIPLEAPLRAGSGRPLAQIVRQPVFVVAALAAILAYGIMNLMMTATPLAMHAHHHPFRDAASVLQWHMIGMFGPSFFTGILIQRFGALAIIMSGVALLLACIATALAGSALGNFWVSLFLLGVGWNFMYVGGSTLLMEAHTPAERARTQAANDFLVFATMAVSSASSGVLLEAGGWKAVGYGALPFLLIATAATLWLIGQRRAARPHDSTAETNRA